MFSDQPFLGGCGVYVCLCMCGLQQYVPTGLLCSDLSIPHRFLAGFSRHRQLFCHARPSLFPFPLSLCFCILDITCLLGSVWCFRNCGPSAASAVLWPAVATLKKSGTKKKWRSGRTVVQRVKEETLLLTEKWQHKPSVQVVTCLQLPAKGVLWPCELLYVSCLPEAKEEVVWCHYNAAKPFGEKVKVGGLVYKKHMMYTLETSVYSLSFTSKTLIY